MKNKKRIYKNAILGLWVTGLVLIPVNPIMPIQKTHASPLAAAALALGFKACQALFMGSVGFLGFSAASKFFGSDPHSSKPVENSSQVSTSGSMSSGSSGTLVSPSHESANPSTPSVSVL